MAASARCARALALPKVRQSSERKHKTLSLCDASTYERTKGWNMARVNFHWDDPLLLDEQLTDEEKMVRDAARDYAQGQLTPRIIEAFRREHTDPGIFKEMGALGLLGATIPEEFGGGGLNYVSYGLIAREVERVDSGYRSMMSVQSSLVMLPIDRFGTDSQKQKYLPALARGESIGCFGLTEPDHGSDPGSMITRARSAAGGYRVSKRKEAGIASEPHTQQSIADKPEADCGQRRAEQAACNGVQHLRANHHAEGWPQREQESTTADSRDGERHQQAFVGHAIDQRAGGNLQRKRR